MALKECHRSGHFHEPCDSGVRSGIPFPKIQGLGDSPAHHNENMIQQLEERQRQLQLVLEEQAKDAQPDGRIYKHL